MSRTVAIGIQSFSDLVLNDCFYIDKTQFIKEWWDSMDSVTLITRPRKFGKTLTIIWLRVSFRLIIRGILFCFKSTIYGSMKTIGNCREHIRL